MTSLRPSPPRSKKESSGANESHAALGPNTEPGAKTAAALLSIFGDPDAEPIFEAESAEDSPRDEVESKDAERAARVEAKADAKAERARIKAEAKQDRAKAKADAKASRDEAKAAALQAKTDAAPQDAAAQDTTAQDAAAEEIAAAKAARSEAKAAAKLEREAAVQARRDARDAARSAPIRLTEPIVDDSDGAERPIAVAGRLQRDEAVAAKQNDEARDAAKAQTVQDARDADEAQEKARVEAAAEKTGAAEAKEKAREEAALAKVEAKRERAEAKAVAKRESQQAKATHRADDHIVQAPREPKKSLLDRILPEQTEKSGERDGEPAASNFLPTLAVVLGALGFVFSVILAIGAFLVALNPQNDGGLFGVVSNVCDFLVGPIRGLFSFSGVNGESKDALVAWGLGALGYLVLGLFAQSFIRARTDDE